jgi:hypothetical protein
LIAAAVLAQASRSVCDGFCTEAQAKRDEALFAENCVTCLGPALEGDGEAPPLSGGEPLAYVLHFDKFPAGATELPHDTASLNQIRYESTKSGSKK